MALRKYSPETKEEVRQYLAKNTIKDASEHFEIPFGTIRFWVYGGKKAWKKTDPNLFSETKSPDPKSEAPLSKNETVSSNRVRKKIRSTEVLAELKEKVFKLYFDKGLSVVTIAEQMGEKVYTINNFIYREKKRRKGFDQVNVLIGTIDKNKARAIKTLNEYKELQESCKPISPEKAKVNLLTHEVKVMQSHIKLVDEEIALLKQLVMA